MADPHPKLSVLVDPPLAEPPPVAEIQRRAKALRRRTVAARGGLGAAVAAVVVAAGIALVPGDAPQTLQAAAPPTSTGTAVAPAAEPGTATVALKSFPADGQEWTMFATRTADPAICLKLRLADGPDVPLGCLTPDGRALQAAAADLRSVSFVYGIVAPDVTVVTLSADGNASTLDLLYSGAGFPVRFIGTVVAPSVTAVELTAARNGRDEQVPVPLPSHRRVAAINGTEVPSAPPSTTPTTPRPPATSTTLAPDTPVSTVVPPTAPSTTVVPGGGQPKRVQPVAGATDLRKQPFQSAAPAGAQALAVRFWSGVEPCYVLGRVDVTETADKVTVTLWTGSGPGTAGMACIQMAGYFEVIVQLQAPLGGRPVVDGAA
jgi:hypothetical protein